MWDLGELLCPGFGLGGHIIQERRAVAAPLSVAADFNGSQLLLSFISRQHQYITTDATNRTVNQHTWTLFVVLAATLDIILTLVINWDADDDDDVDEDYQDDDYHEDDNSNDSRWCWWWWWT